MPITSRLKANSGVTADASNRVSAWADSLNLENLVLWSEDFSNAAWVAERTTKNSNAVNNPLNGELTADSIVEDTATGTHGVYQSVAGIVSGQTYRFSVYAKEIGTIRRLRMLLALQFTNANVQWKDGVEQVAGAGATNKTVVSLDNGWYRYSFDATATGTGTAELQLYMITTGGTSSYTGDGASGYYLFGVQLQLASADSTYYKTTSTAYTLTTIANFTQGTDANKPLLSRADNKGNLLTQSHTPSSWSNNNGLTGFTGKIATCNASTAQHRVSNTTTSFLSNQVQVGNTYRMICRIKYINYQWFWIGNGGDSLWRGVRFDALNGVIDASFNLISSSVVSEGSGWYTLTMVMTQATTANFAAYVNFATSVATSGATSVTTVGTEQVEVDYAVAQKVEWDSDIIETTTFPQYAGVNGRQSLVFNGAQLLTTTSTLANLFTASDGILYAVVRPFITSLAQIVTRSSVAGRKSLYIDSNTFQNYNNDGVQDIASSPTISANNLYIARIRHIGGFIYSAFDIGNGFQEGLAVASANTDNMTYTYSVGSGSSGLYGQILEIVTYNEGTPNLDMERSLRQQYLTGNNIRFNPLTCDFSNALSGQAQVREFLVEHLTKRRSL